MGLNKYYNIKYLYLKINVFTSNTERKCNKHQNVTDDLPF